MKAGIRLLVPYQFYLMWYAIIDAYTFWGRIWFSQDYIEGKHYKYYIHFWYTWQLH
jgi:hypothetical protein